MQTYRNMLTDEVRTFTAEQSRSRNKDVWVLITGVPQKPKKPTPKRDSE